MKLKFNLKREIKIGAVVLVLLFLIAFTERKQGGVAVQDIQVKIELAGVFRLEFSSFELKGDETS